MRAKQLASAAGTRRGRRRAGIPADQRSPALVGVVGPLQLEVLKARLHAEYDIEIGWDTPEFQFARWITADDPKILDRFVNEFHSSIAEDFDGDLVFSPATPSTSNIPATTIKRFRSAT